MPFLKYTQYFPLGHPWISCLSVLQWRLSQGSQQLVAHRDLLIPENKDEKKIQGVFSLGLPRKGQEFLLNPLKPQSVTGKSPVYLLTVLIILSVFRMFFSYFAPLVLVFYDDDVGSALKFFVCLGFNFDLSSSPPMGFGCNSCGDNYF